MALCLLGCSPPVPRPHPHGGPRIGNGTLDGGTLDGEAPVDGGTVDAADGGTVDAADANRLADQAPDVPSDEDCAPLAACGRECVRLASDPLNCGQCGRTCVIPNAEAACIARTCVVAFCQLGFVDTDGAPENGCEDEADPDAGLDPDAGPPGEDCTGIDDDDDGACDEHAPVRCRHAVHRAFGAGHIYTDDLAQARRAPFSLEAEAYFFLYSAPVGGMRPAFLCQHPGGEGGYFLSSDAACGIGREGRQIGFWSPIPLCDSSPLYHLVGDADVFYTTSDAERASVLENLGYEDRGIAGHVWRRP